MPMTSQEMIKLLLGNGFTVTSHSKENKNEKTFLSGTFS